MGRQVENQIRKIQVTSKATLNRHKIKASAENCASEAPCALYALRQRRESLIADCLLHPAAFLLRACLMKPCSLCRGRLGIIVGLGIHTTNVPANRFFSSSRCSPPCQVALQPLAWKVSPTGPFLHGEKNSSGAVTRGKSAQNQLQKLAQLQHDLAHERKGGCL